MQDIRVSLVDKNEFEYQLEPEEENYEEEEEEEDEELKLIFRADFVYSRVDWSKFLSPDGQLRIRIQMQIKEGQDSCSAYQQPEGFSLAQVLAEVWNCGDFTDSILVREQNSIRNIHIIGTLAFKRQMLVFSISFTTNKLAFIDGSCAVVV